jgi:hypothetical protein
MFATKKDFTLLARQVSLSSRETAAKEGNTGEPSAPFLVDVYQVRLWKLIHSPEKSDLDAIAETFQVGLKIKQIQIIDLILF